MSIYIAIELCVRYVTMRVLCAEVKEAGFEASECRGAAFSIHEVKDAGYSIPALKGAKFTVEESTNAGFSIVELRCDGVGFTASECKPHFTVHELKAGGCVPVQEPRVDKTPLRRATDLRV